MRDQAIRLITGAFASFPEEEEVGGFLLEGWYEAQEQSFVHQYLRAGDVFLDVGAHAGLYSTIALGRVGAEGRVIAIEPNADILTYLERNLGVAAQVQIAAPRGPAILAVALSDSDGEAAFAAEGAARSAYASLDFDGAATLRVPTRSLDSLRASGAIGRIDLIKVDIEGAEHLLLEGARATVAALPDLAMVMEFTETNRQRFGGTTADLAALARSLGLTIARIDMAAQTLTPITDDAPLWHENLLLTRNLESVRSRLAAATPEVRAVSDDFARKGAANHQRYAESEALRRLLDETKARAARFDALRALTSGGASGAATGRYEAAVAGQDRAAIAFRISRWLEDELARAEGDVGALVAALGVARRGGGFDASALEGAARALGAVHGLITSAPDAVEACLGRMAAAMASEGCGAIAWLDDEIGRLSGMVQFQSEEGELSRAALIASRNEVRAMGDLALVLNRTRVMALCRALRLAPAAQVKGIVDIFTAEPPAAGKG